jgi:MFS family permease
LHERLGTRRSLIANLLLQAAGVVLPVWHTPSAYILSALLVGATFMGTVTIAMPAARRVAAKVRFNMLAIMTAAHGIGQVIGPLVANALYARTGSFDLPLELAALALMFAACLCFGAPNKKSLQKRFADDRQIVPRSARQ